MKEPVDNPQMRMTNSIWECTPQRKLRKSPFRSTDGYRQCMTSGKHSDKLRDMRCVPIKGLIVLYMIAIIMNYVIHSDCILQKPGTDMVQVRGYTQGVSYGDTWYRECCFRTTLICLHDACMYISGDSDLGCLTPVAHSGMSYIYSDNSGICDVPISVCVYLNITCLSEILTECKQTHKDCECNVICYDNLCYTIYNTNCNYKDNMYLRGQSSLTRRLIEMHESQRTPVFNVNVSYPAFVNILQTGGRLAHWAEDRETIKRGPNRRLLLEDLAQSGRNDKPLLSCSKAHVSNRRSRPGGVSLDPLRVDALFGRVPLYSVYIYEVLDSDRKCIVFMLNHLGAYRRPAISWIKATNDKYLYRKYENNALDIDKLVYLCSRNISAIYWITNMPNRQRILVCV